MGRDAWAISMGRLMEKTENLDKRVVPGVGSYSTKTCHARSIPRRQAGSRTITSGLLGLPGLRPGNTVKPLAALQVQVKRSLWLGWRRATGQISQSGGPIGTGP